MKFNVFFLFFFFAAIFVVSDAYIIEDFCNIKICPPPSLCINGLCYPVYKAAAVEKERRIGQPCVDEDQCGAFERCIEGHCDFITTGGGK